MGTTKGSYRCETYPHLKCDSVVRTFERYCDLPPVRAPAPPRFCEIDRCVRRDHRRRGVSGHVQLGFCKVIKSRIWNGLSPRRMIPKQALIELLESGDVDEGIKRHPKITIITPIFTQSRVEHVVGHLYQ